MNPLTLQSIAQALWMKEYDREKIPPEILAKIDSEKNSEEAYAQRFLQRLQQLEDNQLSFVPPRTDRYAMLRKHWTEVGKMSPREFYTSSLFLGPESITGYEPIPLDPKFDFPGIDLPQLKNQLGWHFFVGNFTDDTGNHYSVELMFWQYSLLPPNLAAELGLSDIENQSLELHLAICDPQTGTQYRAAPVVVAGTTGLVEVDAKPYRYKLGNNTIEGLSADGSLFPVRLRARGWDLGKSPNAEFDIDLSLDNNKGYFMQGDEGCSPSVDGLGTLYYSASLLKLQGGGENTITINGKRIKLTAGSMWYDHQWTTGFMPTGAPAHAVLRASNNISTPAPGGWDWFELQFNGGPATPGVGEVQMTFAAIHSTAEQAFYWQTGPLPPGEMQVSIKGKYINVENTATVITGTMTITQWVKIEGSPDPTVYAPTNTWYPAGYFFQIDTETVPPQLQEFTLTPLIPTGQTGFFGTGLQYTEGGAIIRNIDGAEIGRGFAEGTNWAHSVDTVLGLAGLPANESTRALMTPVKPSTLLVVESEAWVVLDGAELKKLLAEARGL